MPTTYGIASYVRTLATTLPELFAGLPLVCWILDRDLVAHAAWGKALSNLGLEANDIVGRPMTAMIAADPNGAQILQRLDDVLRGSTARFDTRWHNVDFSCVVSPMHDDDGSVIGMIGISLDTSESRAMEAHLHDAVLALQQYESLATSGTYIIDEDTGNAYISPQCAEIWGLPAHEPVHARDFDSRIHVDDRDRVRATRVAAGLTGTPYSTEYRIVRTDGTVRRARARASFVRDGAGGSRIVGTLFDLTEQNALVERLEHLRSHDALTGLLNRQPLPALLQQLLNGRRDGANVAVLLVDLQRFARVNNVLGTTGGDEVLRETARRLVACDLGGATIARIGGDEFCVIVANAGDPVQVREIGHRIARLFDAPFVVNGAEVRLSVNVGGALSTTETAEQLLEHADLALFRARAATSSGTVWYEPAMQTLVAREHGLQSDLHRALDNNQFVLHYQCIVESTTQKVVGAEALLRWNHPTLGLLAPGAFLHLAEENGTITPLGPWTLRQAIVDLPRFRERFGANFHISCNLSARQLSLPSLLSEFRRAVDESGIDPSNIRIEVTEQSLLDDVTSARTLLAGFREDGTRVFVDDFGTGYNSLTHLQDFTIDGVKLDRSFVTNLVSDPLSRAICSSLLTLAQALNLEIVAEGIETHEQQLTLEALGYAQMQGYLFGRPVPIEQLLAD